MITSLPATQATTRRTNATPFAVRTRLLILAIAAALGAASVAGLVVTHPFMEWDASLERWIQTVNWGPLALTFPLFSWIGDAKGAALDAAIFILILVLNRPAWRLVVAGAATGVLYVVVAHVVLRPRPAVGQVLQVLEHPGASSFPSGHTIFVATICALLMLGLGYRYLPKWAVPIGWAIAALVVVAGAISRIYVGAHWPTDVIGGLLIAIAWLALVVSVRRISDGALGR